MQADCPTLLCIAGSDSSGCAGLQADLATLHAFGVHGACAITTVTTQTARGVQRLDPLPAAAVRAQIETALQEQQPAAVKIGMLGPLAVVESIRAALVDFRGPVVLDPVLGSTSGRTFRWDIAPAEAVRLLFPITTLLTPNLPEALILAGSADAAGGVAGDAAQRQLHAWCNRQSFAVLLKGGHGIGDPVRDCLYQPKKAPHIFRHPRIETANARGTGCTLASAIAAGLAHGLDLEPAIADAIAHVEAALHASRTRPVHCGLFHPRVTARSDHADSIRDNS